MVANPQVRIATITLEPSATPIKMKHHPLDHVMEESLRKHTHQWMTQKVIKEAYYPRSSLLVPVLKKNSEEIWWAVDNRKLNVVTKKDTFPLPNIVNNLSWFSGSKVFSALDGARTFHIVLVRCANRDSTLKCTRKVFILMGTSN